MFYEESRLTVCCCNSSTPVAPCSLAGAKIWITLRRIGSLRCSLRRNSAMAIAAGCATTCTAASRASSLSSAFEQRRAQTRVGPLFRGIGQIDDAASGGSPSSSSTFLADSALPARITARRVAEARGVQLFSTVVRPRHASARLVLLIGGDQREVQVRAGGRQVADLPSE